MNIFDAHRNIRRSRELSDRAKLVCAVILDRIETERGGKQMLVAEIAAEAGKCKRSCQRALRELQDKGWLRPVIPGDQLANKVPTTYYLTDKVWGVQTVTPPGVQTVTPPGVQTVTHLKNEESKKGAGAPLPVDKRSEKGGKEVEATEFPDSGHPRYGPAIFMQIVKETGYTGDLVNAAAMFREGRLRKGKGLSGPDVIEHWRRWLARAA